MTTLQQDWRQGKDMRLRPYEDTNLGMPLSLLDAGATTVPTDLFFVRSNYSVPTVDPQTWRLRVHGHVGRPVEISLPDLMAMPQRTVVSFLECAGNGRTWFQPAVPGTAWRDDAVGCAEWSGVPLRHVLELAGVGPDAVDVVSQGADDPAMRRGLPIATALDPDTLIAWQMNGAPLLQAHGAPVRLLVPGWAGIASTKWLVDLEVLGTKFDGYWNTEKYVVVGMEGEALRPVERMPVKSLVASPCAGSVLPAGPLTATGYAWSGCGPVTAVEVSVDGGRTFAAAQVGPAAGPRAWVPWEFHWVAEPGSVGIQSRATDATGSTQPAQPPWNAQGYQMNAVTTVPFEVVSPDVAGSASAVRP